jgi:hypothetical protein
MSAGQQQCVLCGIQLQGRKRRLFCPVEGVKFVKERCKPTPFLHAFLENTLPRQADKLCLCIPCVNWKRRAERGTLKRTARPMLQLDQMILFLMQPGKHQEPDHRCMERLVEAVRQAGNPYRRARSLFCPLICALTRRGRRIFPLPVQRITLDIEGNTFQHCVKAWWEYNGRTEFFASAQEARRVRCALKGGLICL